MEAGLRTGDLAHPFPEEPNRVLVSRIAALHFASTAWAAANLPREGVTPGAIVVTGNTGIDAVLYVRDRLERGCWSGERRLALDESRKLVLVTAHRRESFGEGFEQICGALAELARRPDVQIVYPVHPNPNVRNRSTATWPAATRAAARAARLRAVRRSAAARIDRADRLRRHSGRGALAGEAGAGDAETTERPEAVDAGTARLVGNRKETILEECARLLDDPGAYEAMARAHNPYGDGRASERIGEALRRFLA